MSDDDKTGNSDRFVYSEGELFVVNEDGSETRVGKVPTERKPPEDDTT